MHVLVPLVAALVPLIITPGPLSYFDITPKIAVLLLGSSLSLLYPGANISNVRALLRLPAGRWFAVLLGLTWISSAIASASSAYPMLSLHGGNWRRHGLITESALLIFILFSAGWIAAGPNNLRLLLRACCVSGTLGALYGIAQYFGIDPWLASSGYQAGEGPFTIVRPPGTLGHADYFGAWMVAVTFFGLALAQMEHAWRRVAARACAVLAACAIVLSGTRSALAGLTAGAILLGVLNRSHIRVRAAAAWGALAVACLALFFFSPIGARLRARVHWSAEDVWGGARLLLWRDSVQMSLRHPIFGFGPETFATEFPRFQSIDLARAYPDFYHESPHNMFLDALTTRGAVGLVLLLGLCGLAIWAALRRSRPELAAGFLAILVCQQFVVFVVATALYFYLLVAMLITEPAQPVIQPKSARWFIPVGLAASLVFLLFTVHLLMADRSLAITNERIQSGDALGAAKEYSTVLAWQVKGAGSDLSYSRNMAKLAARTPIFENRVQAAQQAMDAAIRATRTAEDRQNAWYNLATLLAGQGDATGVERALRNAIAWAPNWFKPHWTLAQLLEATNRHGQALTEARIALDLDGGHDAAVAETWQKLQPSPGSRP